MNAPGDRFKTWWLNLPKRHPRFVLGLLVAACLGPFVGRPLHIDDPLFVWMAQHIVEHPFDPYGFTANWYGTEMPMAAIMQNPPLTAYLLAAGGSILGWSERALHAVFLLPAAGAAIGAYEVARRLCPHPLLAALATVLTPVFLVSGTSLMSDMLLLCLWVWAVALWLRGVDDDNTGALAGTAVLVCFAELTKYFGACLIPLLAVYALAKHRRFGLWTVWLAVPALALAGFEWWTATRYGHGLLAAAGDYAAVTISETGVPIGTRAMSALAFLGGSLVWPVVSAPWRWRAPVWIGGLGLTAVMTWAVFMILDPLPDRHPLLLAPQAWVWCQATFWAAGGLAALGMAVTDVWKRRDAGAWLLASWVAGTLAFAAFINWTVAARSLLPLAPALAILFARRPEERGARGGARLPLRMGLALVPAGALALLLAQVDFAHARAVNQVVRAVRETHWRPGATTWFEGHWGFQYYMERHGARALDRKTPRFARGDLLIVPANNTNARRPPANVARPAGGVEARGSRWLSVFNPAAGAGFYSFDAGPLPFALGEVPPETATVYEWIASAEELGKAQELRQTR